MKRFIFALSTGLCLAFPSIVSAFTYTEGNLLLIFRQEGLNDVEFNLGSVSNYFGKANGTVIPVTNWSKSILLSNFNNNLFGVSFILCAGTGPLQPATLQRAWITDSETNNAKDLNAAVIAQFVGKVRLIGSNAETNTFSSAAQYYVVSSTLPSSYSDLVSDDASQIPVWGGTANFSVEQGIPGTSRFFELKRTTVFPGPDSTMIGSFVMDEAGSLTFIAGSGVLPPPPAPSITSVTRSNSVTTISFTTANSISYRLRSTTVLDTSVTNWTVIGSNITGNGSVMSLQDTSTGSRFYAVEALR